MHLGPLVEPINQARGTEPATLLYLTWGTSTSSALICIVQQAGMCIAILCTDLLHSWHPSTALLHRTGTRKAYLYSRYAGTCYSTPKPSAGVDVQYFVVLTLLRSCCTTRALLYMWCTWSVQLSYHVQHSSRADMPCTYRYDSPPQWG